MKQIIAVIIAIALVLGGMVYVLIQPSSSMLPTTNARPAPEPAQAPTTTIPAIPSSPTLPDPVPMAPVVTVSPLPVQPRKKDEYSPGNGPCAPGQNNFGPGGAFGQGCPLNMPPPTPDK